MLEPVGRTVLTDALSAPAGFRVDRVIATTYTLDLTALLTLPLAFTLQAGDLVDESSRADPIALLDALRRHAKRIHVFCDRIHVPKRGQLLFSYLEGAVIEAAAPNGGAFHPKVTIVRYVRDPSQPTDNDIGDDAVRYRVLCSTRNLTFDRSWDTVLVLEGDVVQTRTLAFTRNRPLARFVDTLPRLAYRTLPDQTAEVVRTLADELLRVQFGPPEGFGVDSDQLAFWPLGLEPGETWPFIEADRLMVISPFVDEACLKRLQGRGRLTAIVSRSEELDTVSPATIREIKQRYVLADAAHGEAEELNMGAPDNPAASPADGRNDDVVLEPCGTQMVGLHAKLFLAETGGRVRLWTGSANATTAAFTRNVEFLVELGGKKKDVGIDALLAKNELDDKRKVGFRSLLVEYQPPAAATKIDPLDTKLEQMLQEVQRALASTMLISRVTEASDAPETLYDVRIERSGPDVPQFPAGVQCRIRPISLPVDQAVAAVLQSATLATFHSLALESLTGFCAVHAVARIGVRTCEAEFVLSAPILGGPHDRENRLLTALLSNRERLLRYLLMLLDASGWILPNGRGGHHSGWSGNSFGPFGLPLLEPLLRTLGEHPERLHAVDRLVRDLQATEEGRKLLPPEFVSLWNSVQSLLPQTNTTQSGEHRDAAN